jgi:putative transposase
MICAFKILQVKYRNNILEQDHRFIKRITAPTLDFLAFHTAAATVAVVRTFADQRRARL